MIPQLPSMRESMTEFAIYVFIALILIAGVLLFLYLTREHRLKQNVWNRFNKMATDKGLDRVQYQLLLRLSRANRLNNPLLLLTALNVFDRYVGGYAARQVEKGSDDNDEVIKQISKIRSALGFDTLKRGHPMRTTRQLTPGQNITLLTDEEETDMQIACVVVSRDDYSITAALMLRKDERHLSSWSKGDVFVVRLALEGHAEYRFDTEILDSALHNKQIVLKHSEKVERTQARDFMRWNVNFPLTMYLISKRDFDRLEMGIDLDGATYFESTATNISGGGLSIRTEYYVPPKSLLMADPDFIGDFPLAGVVCETIGRLNEEDVVHNIHMKFVDLPNDVEKSIVRTIFQLQIEASDPLS